jgi:hypothetical protein
MMKKVLSAFILLSILVVSMWCLTFKAYYDTNDEVASRLSLGDWPGALYSIKTYKNSILSYPVYNFSKLGKYRYRLYSMKEKGLNKAQSLLNETLMLDPNDVDAKINLELMLKKIQARQKVDLPEETEKKESIRPQAEPGEQWRLDIPDKDGEGSGASSGQSFL